jgi:hypothetical protein
MFERKTMREINHWNEMMLDAQTFINDLKDSHVKRPATERELYGDKYAGESRQERRARERAEAKAARKAKA